MKIGICLFEKWHGKRYIGSSRLRGHNLIKYWKDAEIYKQSCNYDVVIFQKVYWGEFVKRYKGIKILDVCDADFLHAQPVMEMVNNVDAITCSTKALKKYYEQLTDKPIFVIPDRQDLAFHSMRKVHKGKAKTVVWFGYGGNSGVLDKTLLKIKRLKLKLAIISDMDYKPAGFLKKIDIINKRWDIETINENIMKYDIALLPKDDKGNFKFKSNNKKTKAWLLGMPVAEEPEDLDKFIDAEARRLETQKRRKEVMQKYDIKKSVLEFQNIINEVKSKREKPNNDN